MITIFIDNKPYQVKEGQNLLQACLSLGLDLPYFCWHPAMHSVGACRQCAVKLFRDEKDTRGRIVMSCMTPVADGMRLSVDDPEARSFRAGVIEWLMLSHPHDCPVCDEGGECHLQDMTVMTGHTYRRTRFKKRTHCNQHLGPFINHEMNRCIQCYRCVRFYRDYAGGRDFHVFACHDHVYFGRHEEGALENEFSGNLVEVCPTGVFTDKTLKRHYTRKWDLQTAPSVCVHCGLGCNTIAGERSGALRRILNRYNHDVNGYFLCDRGRFGYEFVNSDRRIRTTLISPSLNPSPQGREQSFSALSPGGRGLGEGDARTTVPVSKETALQRISDILSKSKRVIGIGSPRASLEANFALRALVGPDNFSSGMPAKESQLTVLVIDILRKGLARSPSLHDVAQADAVLLLGEDVTNTAPMLALALRQSVRNRQQEIAAKMKIPEWDDNAVRNAAQNEKSPLYSASYGNTKLDDVAAKTYHAAPDDIARLGFAVAHELNPDAPAVMELSPEDLALAKEISQALRSAKRPLVVSGMSSMSEAIIQAAANVAWALCGNGKKAELCYTVPECNTMGLGLMAGRSLSELLQTPDPLDTLIILENDLYRRADQETVDAFLGRSQHVIVIDHLLHATSAKADVVLPAGAFAESCGTLVNNEGRAQRSYQVFVPPGEIQQSWKWIRDIMKTPGSPMVDDWQSLDALIARMASTLSVFNPIKDGAPPADVRVSGMRIPRQPHRSSGRTALFAHITMHEPGPPEDPDSPLAFSMEGYEGRSPSALISRYWSPAWNSVQALNKFQQEVGGPLLGGDPGKRLIEGVQESRPSARMPFFQNCPGPFQPGDEEWLLVPLYHIFGSEELSVLSPGIAGRAPAPSLALNPEDAARIAARNGGPVEFMVAGKTHRLRVSLVPDMPKGTAGVPRGLPGLPFLALPAWCRTRAGQ